MICALGLARLYRLAPRKSIWIQHSQMVMPSLAAKILSRIRWLAFLVDGMVLVSEGGRKAVCSRGWPNRRTTVIRNGIPISPTLKRGWLRPALGLPTGAVVVASVGSLIPRKGYEGVISLVRRFC